MGIVFLGYVLTDEPETVNLGTARVGIDTSAAGARAVAADEAPPEAASDVQSELPEGEASYYGDELAGRPTASGERFDPARMTAAHRTLPMGTRLRVTNVRNGESVIVRVNDRGPFSGNRALDLSYAAARQIGMIRTGTSRVRIEILR